jgi:three-Cys-motif partner protein
MPEDFFEEQLPGSKIKSKIVSSYFWKWAKVMVPQVKKRGKKIGYLDFFCGPGKYKDGTDSTPLLILKAALTNSDMSDMLVTVFNDKEPLNVEKLETEINAIETISKLKNKPTFIKSIIGKDIVEQLKQTELIPSLIFIDPFGYKGLTLDLIASVIKDWGCDCIFFFNYNRINAALNNPAFKENVNSLFGEETANLLRKEVKGLNPSKREKLILEYFQEALKKIKGDYFVSFKFYKEGSKKTSHFIFFVAKHPLAYHLMKQTMAENCKMRGGIPTYEYRPGDESKIAQTDLFSEDNYEIQNLAEKLLHIFKGKTTTRKKIYEEHNIGKPYIENNYKEALLLLEQKLEIIIDPPIQKRKLYQGKPTLGENVILKF